MTINQLTDNQKETLKNQIITKLYNSQEIHNKVAGICHRNFIKKETYIAEDITQETFLLLAKKSADEIISMYYDDGRKPDGCLSRLVGLCVTIACMRGVANDKEQPKRSLANFILFASNFKQHEYLNPCESSSDEDSTSTSYILVDQSTQEDNYTELWNLIRSELTPEENQSLDFFLNLKKKQGRYRKDVKQQYQHLLHRIEEIITNHKIHI